MKTYNREDIINRVEKLLGLPSHFTKTIKKHRKYTTELIDTLYPKDVKLSKPELNDFVITLINTFRG